MGAVSGSSIPARSAGGSKLWASLSHHAEVVVVLAQADLLDRYGRGGFRLVRWLLDPFLLLGIYLLLVVYVLDRPGEAPGLSLACAIVPYQLVMATVTNCLDAVHARESIILNMAFERALVPPAVVLMETAGFLASLSMIGLTMAAYGVAPTAAVLSYPLVFAVTVILALAIAYPTTLFGVWFRQSRTLMVGFFRALFFLAPGLVPLSETSDTARRLLELNPLTGLFEAHRDVFVNGEAPAFGHLAYPLLAAAVLLAVFVPLYRLEQSQLAKVVE